MRLHDISKKLNSSLEARMLVKCVTGLSDADLITSDDSIVMSDEQKKRLEDYVQQRLNGRPISKIIGIKEFYGRDFIVNDDVLDPRPDSELIVDVILKNKSKDEDLKILDMGVGSGCLVLTLLSEFPNTTAVGTDISSKALNIAKENAESLGVCERVCFIESNWFESVEGVFDIIVSNPPYIESNDIPNLSKEVTKYDPILALDGGEDGLNPYRVILPQVQRYLKKDGIVTLEHGKGQSSRIKRLVENAGLSDIEVHYDLGGHDRVISAIHK